MKKSIMIIAVLYSALAVFASGKKDVTITDDPFGRPHYGEGGGSGVANLPFDAPEITPDMVGDTTQIIGEKETVTVKGTVKISAEGSEQVVYVSTGLFSKLRLVFVDGVSELTAEDFVPLSGKKVTLRGWYADGKKCFAVIRKE